jgi:hypothetical protein
MTRRRIETLASTDSTRQAVVYRDVDWAEYRVVFYLSGLRKNSYHTDDLADALSTARAWVDARATVASTPTGG